MSVGNEIKGIAKHSAIYGVGNALQAIPPFLLLPLYLNYLDASDYGIKEIIAVTVELAGIVISLGITTAMSRFYYEYDTQTDRNEVVSTILIATGAVALIGVLVLSTQSSLLAASLLNSRALSLYFYVAFASFWFNTMYNMGCDYLRILEKSKLYVATSTMKLILALGLNVYFVAFLKMKVLGILLSSLVCSMLFCLLLIAPILFKIGFGFSMKKCVDILKFSIPFIATNLAGFIVHASDRIFLKYYGTLSLTGVYTLGYRMGSSVNTFVTSPFTQIWQPRRFAIYKEPHANETYARVLTYYLAAASFIGVWLSLVSKDALLIMGKPEFYEAGRIVPIIVLGYVIFGLHYHVNIGIMLTKKTQSLAVINTGNAALNIALNFLLIPRYGMYGAAIATLVCFANKVAWTWWASNKLYPLQFEYQRILTIALAAAIVFAVGWSIPYPAPFEQHMSNYAAHARDLRLLGVELFLIRSCVMVLFAGILYFAGFWLPEEKQYARGLLYAARTRLASL